MLPDYVAIVMLMGNLTFISAIIVYSIRILNKKATEDKTLRESRKVWGRIRSGYHSFLRGELSKGFPSIP